MQRRLIRAHYTNAMQLKKPGIACAGLLYSSKVWSVSEGGANFLCVCGQHFRLFHVAPVSL